MFFEVEDFECLEPSVQSSDDHAVMADRKELVERFKILNDGIGTQVGLKQFCESKGLHPHWRKEHLTNIWYPVPKINNGTVTHVRMGYGKDQQTIKLLEQFCGDIKEKNGLYVARGAFYRFSQLEIGIDDTGWWVGFHLDKDGWPEQNNLLVKAQTKSERRNFINLIEDLQTNGFDYGFYNLQQAERWPEYDLCSADDCLKYMEILAQRRLAYSFAIRTMHGPEEKNMKKNILAYIKDQFELLLPIYEFISWHPIYNNYMG